MATDRPKRFSSFRSRPFSPVVSDTRRPVSWLRWDEAGFAAARARLQSKPPAEFTLEDWMLAVDYIIQRYLPEGVIDSEAQYLTVRAAILGQIQANLEARGDNLSDTVIDGIAAALPVTVRGVTVWLNGAERATLVFARAHAGDSIPGLDEETRSAIKNVIVQHFESRILGIGDGHPKDLGSRLFDEFGALNLDLRHNSASEEAESSLQGYVAASPLGGKIKWLEPVRSACPYCDAMRNRVFTVVSSEKPDKDPQTEVWVGKPDLCGVLAAQARGEYEFWEDDNPHLLRGRWLPVPGPPPPGVSPAFAAELERVLAQGRSVLPKVANYKHKSE